MQSARGKKLVLVVVLLAAAGSTRWAAAQGPVDFLRRADGGLRQVSNVAVSPRLRLNPNGTLAYSPPPVTTLEEAAARRSITVGGRIRCSRGFALRRFWGDAGNSG